MSSDPFEKQWPVLMGVSRRDIAHAIADAREPDAEHEQDDPPDWAIEEALRLSDDAMEGFTARVSEYLYDEERFYWVVGFTYEHHVQQRPI